jgi:hypothetical protein
VGVYERQHRDIKGGGIEKLVPDGQPQLGRQPRRRRCWTGEEAGHSGGDASDWNPARNAAKARLIPAPRARLAVTSPSALSCKLKEKSASLPGSGFGRRPRVTHQILRAMRGRLL